MVSFKSFRGFDHRLLARTRLATIRSDCFGGRTQVLSSKTRRQWFGFWSPPSKPVQPNLPEERTTRCEFQAFQRVPWALRLICEMSKLWAYWVQYMQPYIYIYFLWVFKASFCIREILGSYIQCGNLTLKTLETL